MGVCRVKLTKKQQFWRDHILAAKKEQLSYAEYAKRHDLNRQALYNWSLALRRKGLLDPPTPAFVELKVESSVSSLWSLPHARVRLANGVELELPGLNEQALRWLAAL